MATACIQIPQMAKDSLEDQLHSAILSGDKKSVSNILHQGANIHFVCLSGKTLLGIAAEMGNVHILQILLSGNAGTDLPNRNTENFNTVSCDLQPAFQFCASMHDRECTQDKCSLKCSSPKQNLGYFVVIHDESGTLQSSCEDSSSSQTVDENWNSSGGTFTNCPLNDMKTPDGMDKLEWDEELADRVDCNEEDDTSAGQYRWYADILDRTSSLLLQAPRSRDLNHQDLYGRCAMHYAAARGNSDCVRLLIASGCHVDIGDWDSVTPLHLAAIGGHVEVGRLLLCSGVRVNAKTSDHTSALHYAASRGHMEMCRLLLDAGAEVDSLDISDRSALMVAVSREQIEVVRLLIKNGARVNLGEMNGCTPLGEAVSQQSTEMVQLLLEAGAKISQTCHLLHYAILHQHYEMAVLLIQTGSLINFRDNSGSPPLAFAAKSGDDRIAKLLLTNGANVNCSNSITGSTPLHEAVESIHQCEYHKFENMFHVLHSYGASLNLPAVKEIDTPLHRAILMWKYKAAMLLIRHGSDVRVKPDVNSSDILYIALKRGCMDLTRMIVYAGFNLQQGTSYLSVNNWSQDSSSIASWLVHMKSNPLRLSDLCRIQIRRHLGEQVYKKINASFLPPTLKKFIRLEDIET